MANFLDKFKINTAIDDYTKLDLSSDHISTANFMQFNVAWSKELVPGERISMNMETFTRLQPLPVPTFGRALINNRAFFVPFRTIFPGWTDFITDSRHTFSNGTSGLITHCPRIDARVFYTLLVVDGEEYGLTIVDDVVETNKRYDLITENGKGIVYTSKGRQMVKILNSLGYQILVPTTNLDDDEEISETMYVSALPLLATAKVYADWYYPSAYAGTPSMHAIEAIFQRDDSINNDLDANEVRSLLNFVYTVNYDSDYFVSAWQNPMTPNDDTYSGISIPDITFELNGNTTSMNVNNSSSSNGTPTLFNQSADSLGKLTQFGLNALRSLTDYMKRHQMVGSRALDRYMSRFGVALSPEKLKRSVYIGSGSQHIQFGDVMSTAETEGANIGDYAGKGVGFDKSQFSFETDEYGMMLVISTIQPKTGYYQGFDRNVLHTSRLDFWTPEFDNLGTQAIAKSELYVPYDQRPGEFVTDMQIASLNNGVFGFTPRYSEYKIGRDRLTGDLRYNSINVGQEAWHTMRELKYDNADDIVITREFISGEDAGQYSRIFQNTDPNFDKFQVIYHFDVTSQSPMKSMYDTYEFEDKGKEIEMQSNGVRFN